MKYEMNLESQFFYYLKNGTKRIEIRLNDEKRSKLKKGDIIRFKKFLNESEYVDTKVEELLYFDNFSTLVNSIDITLLADKEFDKNDLLKILNRIYSLELQNKYGVVGIKVSI